MLGFTTFESVILLIILLVGMFLIDGYVLILGKDIGPGQDIGGRIMFTMGQLINEASALVQNAQSEYEMVRLRGVTDADRDAFSADEEDEKLIGVLVWPNGDEKPLWGDESNITRLGKKPFAVSYEKGEEVFADVKAPEMPGEREALTDLNYGSYPIYQRVVPDGGYHVSVKRMMSRLQDAGSPKIADIKKDLALEKYGGDTGGMEMWKAGLVGLFCAVMGWLMMFVGGGGF